MNYLVQATRAIPGSADGAARLAAMDFQARQSTLTCLLGPDYAVPTAYLQMLAGIQVPYQGQLEILGKPVDKLDHQSWKYIRTHTGYVAGNTPLLSVQTGLANVMLPALYHQIAPADEVERRARKLLTRLGCRFDIGVLPSFMSNLERCLVGLARTLILDPQVLFLEYPFQKLDTDERKRMAMVLAQLKQDDKLCIIIAVNNLRFVKDYADEIFYISDKETIHYKDWDAFASSREPDVQNYIDDEGGSRH